jgi:hypothetical protein
MADYHVHSFNSTVQAMDAQSLLNKQTMDRIVAEVLRRLQELEQHDQRMAADRNLNNSVLDRREA